MRHCNIVITGKDKFFEAEIGKIIRANLINNILKLESSNTESYINNDLWLVHNQALTAASKSCMACKN